MREYFEAEMRLFQEAAGEFARLYPEQAGMLNLEELRDRDPYVERLLEGMAFLTAQVRQRLDDDVPELCEALLNQLWPHFLRPFPAATIVQLTPRPGQLQQPQTLAPGAMLLSPPVGEERVICRFRTTSPVELLPIHLHRVVSEQSSRGGQVLRFSFQFDAGVEVENLEIERIKLFLHADAALGLKIFHLVTAGVSRAVVRFSEADSAQVLGGQECVQPCHLGLDDLLVPGAGRSFLGYHLLQEYFCFREKYLFVSLEKLGRVVWPRGCQEFETELHLSEEFALEGDERVSREHFRLHCTPAVNLFETSAEPVRLDHRRSEFRLVPDSAAPAGVEIYSVDGVTGIDADSGRRSEYHPLHTFRHKAGAGPFYQVSRRQRDDDGAALHLAIGGRNDYSQETLSCKLTACNADLPRTHVREAGLNLPTSDLPSYLRFGNLLRPTGRLQPPPRRDFRLSLLSHLALNFSSLDSPEALQQLLRIYDWSGREQNRRRIAGVRDLQVIPRNRIRRGGLLRGLEVRISLQEDHFLNHGDAYLFGQLLHVFFSRFALMNTFVETLVILQPSQRKLRWQPLPDDIFPG